MRTKKPTTRERAWALLRKLGSCAAEVAFMLREAGVRGFRGHCHYCPLSRWLERNHIYGAWISTAIFVLPGFGPDTLPEGAKAFRVAFDRGEYPDLEYA